MIIVKSDLIILNLSFKEKGKYYLDFKTSISK